MTRHEALTTLKEAVYRGAKADAAEAPRTAGEG